MGQTWGPSGADRTPVGSCWPHKLCYLWSWSQMCSPFFCHFNGDRSINVSSQFTLSAHLAWSFCLMTNICIDRYVPKWFGHGLVIHSSSNLIWNNDDSSMIAITIMDKNWQKTPLTCHHQKIICYRKYQCNHASDMYVHQRTYSSLSSPVMKITVQLHVIISINGGQ